jgi:hypothetical protein
MTERIPGTFYKSRNFLHCHKCGKRTMWRRYTRGFHTDRLGNKSVAVITIPYCKLHDEVKRGARHGKKD